MFSCSLFPLKLLFESIYIFNLKVVIRANCIMILPSRHDRHIKDSSKKG